MPELDHLIIDQNPVVCGHVLLLAARVCHAEYTHGLDTGVNNNVIHVHLPHLQALILIYRLYNYDKYKNRFEIYIYDYVYRSESVYCEVKLVAGLPVPLEQNICFTKGFKIYNIDLYRLLNNKNIGFIGFFSN